MKILFLDFDGVLNSEAFFRAHGNRYLPETLDTLAVARLNAILARTGARVVVSSTWRLGYSQAELQAILERHGFAGEIIGVTPQIEEVDADGIRVALHRPRGQEIQAWLSAQPEAPEAFVILDDQDDMEHLAGRMVQTTFATGLGDPHVEAAVQMLGAAS